MFSSFQILRNRRFLLEDLKSVVVSNLPKECFFLAWNTTFHANSQRKVGKSSTWWGLTPAAASSNCFTLCSLECLACFRATNSTRVQVRPGVGQKSMCFCFCFLPAFVHAFVLLEVSPWQKVILCLKHIVSRVTWESFTRSPGEKSHAESCGRLELLGKNRGLGSVKRHCEAPGFLPSIWLRKIGPVWKIYVLLVLVWQRNRHL